MRTTYKILPLLQKGYPTLFWIASSNYNISRDKPTSVTRTGSSIYTINHSTGLHSDCILNLTQIFPIYNLTWQQPLVDKHLIGH